MLFSAVAGAVLASGQSNPPPPLTDFLPAFSEFKGKQEDIGGFVKIPYTITESQRKQAVYIRKSASEYRSLKVVEIYSLVWESDQEPSNEQVLKAAEIRFSVGHLVFEAPSESQPKYRYRFRVTVDSDITFPRLKAVLDVVAATGDGVEKQLSPDAGDVF